MRHATRYELVVSADENFTLDDPTTEKCYTRPPRTPRLRQRPVFAPQGQTFYWKVGRARRSQVPQVNGIYSDTGHFVYDSGRIQPISPADGSTVAVPTFRWQPSSDANAYRITLTER